MPDIVVRQASQTDAMGISRVHEAGWRAGYVELFPPEVIEEVAPERCSITKWNSILSSDKDASIVFVAHRTAEIIGFVQFGQSGDTNLKEHAEIFRFYVTPSEWGKGSAQLLMDAAIERLSQTGTTTISLWTPATPRSKRFYERNLFVATGVETTSPLTEEVQATDKQYVRKLHNLKSQESSNITNPART